MIVPFVWLTPKKGKGLVQSHPASGRLHHTWHHRAPSRPPWEPSRLTSRFARSGVARILTHEAGVTDIAVLQVTFLLLC